MNDSIWRYDDSNATSKFCSDASHFCNAHGDDALPENIMLVNNRISNQRSRKKQNLRSSRAPVCLMSRRPMTVLLLLCLLTAVTVFAQEPTALPSNSTTDSPTQSPSPTESPSTSPVPTITSNPTGTPNPTKDPTKSPTMSPTITASPTVSPAPTTSPSWSPTLYPTELPSVSPTNHPTITFRPSASPTLSLKPSVSPTVSPQPSWAPTLSPTVSPAPTEVPSYSPSVEPTFESLQLSRGKFKQRFQMDETQPLNDTEQEMFESVVVGYTEDITTEDRINTTSVVLNSAVVELRRRLRDSTWTESVQSVFQYLRGLQERVLEVEYTVEYKSLHSNVTGLPREYRDEVNGDLDEFTDRLNEAGLTSITESFRAESVIVEASAPPSFSPSAAPSFPPSIAPSRTPSVSPTNYPTGIPTWAPSGAPSREPTFVPSASPDSDSSGMTATIIAVVVAVLGGLILVGSFFYWKKRQWRKKEESRAGGGASQRFGNGSTSEAPAAHESVGGTVGQNTIMISNRSDKDAAVAAGVAAAAGAGAAGAAFAMNDKDRNDSYATPYDSGLGGMISPTDSLLSQPSLLSVGEYNGGESGDEADGTHHLADEFDEYKDKNLEKMRTKVEGNLNNFDGMMSQALTKALMDDDDSPNPKELLWGGSGDSMEIEASALWEVTGWLKRMEGATLDEKQMFMQETLNKMVASVRHGVIGPEHASRAIHECAAILGLELAEEFPKDTIMVTGMRKTVRRENVIEAFEEFGEIDDAAVSANNRGFGLVRFKSTKSVDLAMARVRTEEIVVQDVAVMCKVVQLEGNSSTTTSSMNGRPTTPWRQQPGFPPKSEMDRQYSGPSSTDADRMYPSATPEPARASSAPVTRQPSRESDPFDDRLDDHELA